MRKRLYYLARPANLDLKEWLDDIPVLTHRFLTRCASRNNRIAVDGHLIERLAVVLGVDETMAADAIHQQLLAGNIREVGVVPPVFGAADWHTDDELDRLGVF